MLEKRTKVWPIKSLQFIPALVDWRIGQKKKRFGNKIWFRMFWPDFLEDHYLKELFTLVFAALS